MVLQRELAVRALDRAGRWRRARRRGSRSSPACSPFRHLHHRRPQQPIAEHVAAAELLDHFAFAPAVGGLVRDRLWKCGSKSAPSDSIGLTPRLRSISSSCLWISSTPRRMASVASPPASAFSARSKSSTSGSSSSSRSAAAASRQLDALALDALAVVVELGGLAQQPIVVVVALLLQLGRIGRGLRLARPDLRRRWSSRWFP